MQDDLEIAIETEDCEAFQMAGAVLLLARADAIQAMGFLELAPGQETQPWSFPVPGVYKLVGGHAAVAWTTGQLGQVELNDQQAASVPEDFPHSLKNLSTDKTLIYWKFTGNAEAEFERLKQQCPRISFQGRPKSGYKELFAEHRKAQEEGEKVTQERLAMAGPKQEGKKKGFFGRFRK